MNTTEQSFQLGEQQIKLAGFQAESVQLLPSHVSGFDVSFLSHWPYLKSLSTVDVPPKLISFFNENSQMFCRDNLPMNEAWSYFSLLGGFESIFDSNSQLAFKQKNINVQFNDLINKMCPELMTQISLLPFKLSAATVIALQPKSRVCVHIDKQNYGLDKFLIPLNTPQDSHFIFYNYGAVPLVTGSVYAIDASHMHYVINQSDEVRYNLIVRGLLEDSFLSYLDWIKKSFDQSGMPTFYKVPSQIEYAPANLIEDAL